MIFNHTLFQEPNEMLEAVLLDLDNTMILFDEMTYFRQYFARIGRAFDDLFTPQDLQQRIVEAILALDRNSGAMSNQEFFMQHFMDGVPFLPDNLWRRFEQFYENEYGRFGVEVHTPQGLHAALETLRENRLKLVVATNPMYPLRAIEKRMAWGGVNPRDFDLITHMGNMSFVKPRLEYYLEICQKMGLHPPDCLMVGNDPVNDMIAGNTGMKTYLTIEADAVDYSSLTLTTDGDRKPADIPSPDFSGPFGEILRVIGCFQTRMKICFENLPRQAENE
jgi:FMN phosphatase YigB (HAD superfamily)